MSGIATQAFFIGPQDAESCDGCDDAIDNNPYTLEDVPEPGSFECQSRCRHMVQLDGEAPEGVETVDWSSDLGFVASGAAKGTDDAYGGTKFDDEGKERAEAAGIELADLTADEAAVVDMDPQEIAQYLADNGLSIDDVDSILSDDDAAAVRAEMQAIDYVPPDEADATDLKDMLAAGASESIDAYVDANGVDDLKTLASGGFKDEDSAQAYYLAEALDTAEPDIGWEPEFDPDTLTWTVTTRAQRAAKAIAQGDLYGLHQGIKESMREGGENSGNKGHAGRPGQRGGSKPGAGPPSQKLINQRARTARIKAEKAAADAKASGSPDFSVLQQTGQLLPPSAPKPVSLFDRKELIGEHLIGTDDRYIFKSNDLDSTTRAVINGKLDELEKAYPELNDLVKHTGFGATFETTQPSVYQDKAEVRYAKSDYMEWSRAQNPDPTLDAPMEDHPSKMTPREFAFHTSMYQSQHEKDEAVVWTNDKDGHMNRADNANVPPALVDYFKSLTPDYNPKEYVATGPRVEGLMRSGQAATAFYEAHDQSSVIVNWNADLARVSAWDQKGDRTTRQYFDDPKERYASMITHETGHVLHSGLSSSAKAEWDDVANKALGLGANPTSDPQTNTMNVVDAASRFDTKVFVSEYGTTNGHELLAESFVLYRDPELQSRLPSAIKAFFDKHLKGE